MGKMWINLFNILIRACTCRPPGKHYFQSFSFCKTDIGNAKTPSCILILNIQKILFKVGGLIICRPVPGRQNINRTWHLSVPLFPGPKTSTRIEFTYGTHFPHPLLGHLSSIHQLTDPLWHYDTGQNICVPLLPSEIRMKRIWWKPQENPWKIVVSHLAWFSSLPTLQQTYGLPMKKRALIQGPRCVLSRQSWILPMAFVELSKQADIKTSCNKQEPIFCGIFAPAVHHYVHHYVQQIQPYNLYYGHLLQQTVVSRDGFYNVLLCRKICSIKLGFVIIIFVLKA